MGYTPLHQAAQQGHSQIVNLLLETGRASPNTVSNVSTIYLFRAQSFTSMKAELRQAIYGGFAFYGNIFRFYIFQNSHILPI